MCWHYIVNSYDYYCHLLRSNIRYWQELLIIITGCLSFIGYIVHITNNDVKIGGRIIIYSCGPLYILTCLWYCVKQFQWIMFKFFIYQSHTLLLIISVLVLMTMEIIVAIQIDHDPTMHIVFAFFFSFTIFIFLGMETVNNVSLILYIFYPLIIFIACLINIIRSFSWKTIMIKDGDIHSFSFAQIDRLIQGQIALFTFISFLIAINNPSRKHHIFLYKKIQRFNSVHYDATYESFKKLSLGLQILWVLIATALLIFEYSHSEIKYYIFDCGVVAILIFITIGLIYIEFDWKVLSQVLSSQTSIILIICFFALFMANLMLLEHIVTQNFILVSLNELYWIFGILYMIMIDGFRNCRCWHRIIVYLFFILKSFTSIARTFFDWIDVNLYPESTVWLENNPKQTKIIDNVDRFGWYFVGIIALLSLIKTLTDPQHQYFIMKMERLSRDEVFNIINDKDNHNKNRFKSNIHSSPILSPIIESDHKISRHHRKSSLKSSMIASHGGELIVEVEEEDATSNAHNHSIATDSTMNASNVTNEYGGYQYGYRTLLKMDL